MHFLISILICICIAGCGPKSRGPVNEKPDTSAENANVNNFDNAASKTRNGDESEADNCSNATAIELMTSRRGELEAIRDKVVKEIQEEAKSISESKQPVREKLETRIEFVKKLISRAEPIFRELEDKFNADAKAAILRRHYFGDTYEDRYEYEDKMIFVDDDKDKLVRTNRHIRSKLSTPLQVLWWGVRGQLFTIRKELWDYVNAPENLNDEGSRYNEQICSQVSGLYTPIAKYKDLSLYYAKGFGSSAVHNQLDNYPIYDYAIESYFDNYMDLSNKNV